MKISYKKGDRVQRAPGGEYPGVSVGEKATVLRALGDEAYEVRLDRNRSVHIWDRNFFLAYDEQPPATDKASERGAGLKFDGGKDQPRLLHEGVPLALAEVVRTLTFGATKYAAHSWQKVENAADRYQDASYRHDAARCRGEVLDPETNIRHRAHHIINELFLLELELRKEKAE